MSNPTFLARLKVLGSEYGPEVCWPSPDAINRHGYSIVSVRRADGSRGGMQAHRFAYQHLVGPIPEGLVLDHLCRNRTCLNPAHLEPVTLVENVMRGESPYARKKRQTHCKHGHLLSPDNLYPRSDGTRRCRTCARRVNAESDARARLRASAEG